MGLNLGTLWPGSVLSFLIGYGLFRWRLRKKDPVGAARCLVVGFGVSALLFMAPIAHARLDCYSC
jgi:hypothetical protein